MDKKGGMRKKKSTEAVGMKVRGEKRQKQKDITR